MITWEEVLRKGEWIAQMKKTPSMDAWMKEAKKDPSAQDCGMFLFHNGVVRKSPKARVRNGDNTVPDVKGMQFSYDRQRVEQARLNTLKLEGIRYVRIWLNEGLLGMGDDIMLILIGGDIRPHVVEALQFLVGTIKNECVIEKEIY